MNEYIVEESGINWVTVVIFVFIIFIVLIVLAVFELRREFEIVHVGENCLGKVCEAGLICENGVCRSPLNGTCEIVSDCVKEATACFNKKCVNTPLSGVGGNPPCKPNLIIDQGICKVPPGGICNSN